VKNKRYKVPLWGSSPKLARGLGSEVLPHGLPIGCLRLLLLSQQRVDVHELLLLLLVPLGRILHVSVKCILNFSYAKFQPFKVGVDVVQLPVVQSGLSWTDGWW
jgi:hypothetical protein